MKILAIRIKNLASLEGITEIDFTHEPLCSAGIFAITGPTGAGKSTLLDALCLALYAKTPRYRLAENGIDVRDVNDSTIKQDDVRGILRDGTADGYAEVDFAGTDGNHYRARWSVRRARNKVDGSLQNYEMGLRNITTNQEQPGRKTELLAEIERLVGLNFEQFTRSVLLAQGDFTAFLKAGKDEKSSLLEKLTGTHIYSEISKRIFDHHREHQTSLRVLNDKKEGIETLTTEELADLEKQKEGLAASMKLQEEQSANLMKEITWHDDALKLLEGLAKAQQQVEAATKNKAGAVAAEQYLQQVMAIQPARPIVDGLQNIQQQLDSKTQEVTDKLAELERLANSKKTIDTELENSLTQLNAATENQEKAKPLLDEARALDVQVTDRTSQVANSEKDTTALVAKLNEHKIKTEENRKKLKDNTVEAGRLQQWIEEHKHRRPAAENENIILSKLADAKSEVEDLQRYDEVVEKTSTEIESKKKQVEKLVADEQSINEQLKPIQDLVEGLKIILDKLSISGIIDEKTVADALVEDIIEAEAHWKILYANMQNSTALQETIGREKKSLAENRSSFLQTEKQLQLKKEALGQSAKTLDKAKLLAAANVEQLRNHLEPGAPCPVCGSLEHPYASHNPVLDLVLENLEKEHAQLKEEHESLLSDFGSLDNAHKQLQSNISIAAVELEDLEKKIEEQKEKWRGFRAYEKLKMIVPEEAANNLAEMRKAAKAKQSDLQQQINAYNKQKTELETNVCKLTELNEGLKGLQDSIKDANNAINITATQKADAERERNKTSLALDGLKQTLSVYFSSDQWFENWQKDAEAFTRRITDFAAEWKANMIAAEKNATEQGLLTLKQQGFDEMQATLANDLKNQEDAHASLQKGLDALVQSRSKIFNGIPVEETEAKLKKDLLQAKQAWEEKELENRKLQEAITHSNAQKQQLDKDIISLSAEVKDQKQKLTSWINGHNQQHSFSLTEDLLHGLLQRTNEWINDERQALRKLDEALIEAQSVFKEREQKLSAHNSQKLSERPIETLRELHAEARQQWQQENDIAAGIAAKIRADEANKKNIQSLLKAIEKQSLVVDNWGRLNEVIGSADGKKFKLIAQEYTLDVLLGYANKHLEVLSSRYVLQRIPNSLGLQVIDQDMGDEVRTVYSLSGGESFLVSLALALGLASLSSSRMQVESLFIDEGFGSLDPVTLNIAMDALDRLHNQGRKVGVISHLQEMTERINVQIRVSKQHSGKSMVEVI